MPKSSFSSPTITPMNPPSKTLTQTPNPNPNQTLTHQLEADLLHSYQHALLMDEDEDPEPEVAALRQTLDQPQTLDHLIFRDPDDDEEEEDEEEAAGAEEDEELEGEENEIEEEQKPSPNPNPIKKPPSEPNPNLIVPYIDPTPHISSQFYTFNRDSHALMVRCILEGRVATTDEIQDATPRDVLKSWRSVWKDRNEDTAYLTAWKRIQDKLQAHLDSNGNALLYFKSNPLQCVSHVEQWQEIVNSLHADPDLLRHLGLKETVDRIKQSWTVGAKFYGIPESFIRVCVSSCPICSGATAAGASGQFGGAAGRSKRRRFEYTESLEVPAKDVQRRLQQLAAKHKVVLCIRQKYIRYKPFMAEVKDYACHRAGEPSSASGSSSKKARVLKREPYQSKRCGCGFRIRAIVPITNYNEKEKTFVYQEEGAAVFKLYAVHSGHEPGASDGNARIIHRMVGHKGGFDLDPDVYGVREDTEPESFVNLMRDDGGDTHHSVLLQQVQELRIEAGLLEGKIAKMPEELLGSLSRELADILHRLRSVGAAQRSEDALVVGDEDVVQWGNDQSHHPLGHDRMFAKDSEIIEEEDNDFDSALGTIVPWDRITEGCHGRKMLMRESCKPSDKWLMKEDCGDFDEKSILNCGDEEEDKLIKPLRHDGTIDTDPNLVGMQVDGFYHDNTKWYDSPTGLDAVGDSGSGGFT